MKRFFSLLLIGVLLIGSLVGCTGGSSDNGDTTGGHIKFADAGWDSLKFHNALAGLIAEEAYGYTWEEVPGSSPVVYEGILSGEIDVLMEEWTDNLPNYDEDLAAGKLQEWGVNFDDNFQGIYVPRYVIEGDEERGIEAMAPDLKTVEDLKKYPDVFPDDENKGMGRVYGAIPGWEVDQIMHKKFLHYGLDENFIYFRPGSESSLTAALSRAYDRGEAVAGYYWEPTWLMGKYDFVLLEDEPYDPETYKEGKSAMPSTRVTIVSSNDFAEDNPEVVAFLDKYETSSQLTSDALSYMQDTDADYEEAAKWFIKEHEDLINEWMGEEAAKKVIDSIK